jgi:hypothetical protein
MVSLLLDFLHAPELLAVRDEMTEFMRGIEAGTDTVILVRAEDDDWAVGEGNGAAPCRGRLANGAGPVGARLAGSLARVNVPRRPASRTIVSVATLKPGTRWRDRYATCSTGPSGSTDQTPTPNAGRNRQPPGNSCN